MHLATLKFCSSHLLRLPAFEFKKKKKKKKSSTEKKKGTVNLTPAGSSIITITPFLRPISIQPPKFSTELEFYLKKNKQK